MLELSKSVQTQLARSGLTEADIRQYSKVDVEQKELVELDGKGQSDLHKLFYGKPSDARIRREIEGPYNDPEYNYYITWMAPETDDQYVRRVLKENKQKETVKKTKATKAAKERAEYERLKKKYG